MKNNSDSLSPTDYSIRLLRTLEEIEEVREIWKKLCFHPGADIDFYLTILKARQEILRPHVLVLERQERVIGLVVGRLELNRLECKIGYTVLYKPRLRFLTVVHCGIMGELSDSEVEIIFNELYDTLKRSEADVLYFHFLSFDSTLYHLANTKTSFVSRDYLPLVSPHFKMTLPTDPAKLFHNMNSKHRSELRRLPKILEKNFPGQLSYKCFKELYEVERLCADAEQIVMQTYQRGLGVGFSNNDENKLRIALSAKKGWLIAYFLYIDGKPCAFWIGSVYGKTCFIQFTGYDPAYRKYETGTILLCRLIHEVFEKYPRVREIDFGFGDALYKKRFSTQSCQEASVYLFSPTLRGASVNFVRLLFLFISKILKGIMKRINVESKIKKFWRAKLTKKSSEMTNHE